MPDTPTAEPSEGGEPAGGGHFLSELGCAALELARAGFEVFPLNPPCGGDRCLVWPKKCWCSKTPATANGFHDASADLEVVTTWWTGNPDANIGIRPPEGVIVLDVDPRNGGNAADLGQLTDTLMAKTGGGGAHIWYHHAGPAVGRVGGCKGIDIKKRGGYVVVPPSIHPSGDRYEWMPGPDTEIAELPAHLVERVKGPKKVRGSDDDRPAGEPPGWKNPGKPLTELNRCATERPDLWLEVLPPDWEDCDENAKGHLFGRPGRSSEYSACAYFDRPGAIHLFTTADEYLDEGSYSFADLYAWTVGQSAGEVASDINDFISGEENTQVAEWFAEDPGVLEQLREKVRRLGKPEPSTHDELIDPETGDRITLVSCDVTPKATRWVWDVPRDGLAQLAGKSARLIPARHLTLMVGKSSYGKSSVMQWAAAKLTVGELPGMWEGTPRGVIIVSTEEDIAETITPRMILCGADMSRVHTVAITTEAGKLGALKFPQHAGLVRALLRQHPEVGMVILDPLLSTVAKGLSTDKEEVREALEPLATIAADAGVAIVGIVHQNKDYKNVDNLTRVMGATATHALPRSVLLCTEEPQEDEQSIDRVFLFGQIKNSLSRTALEGHRYTMFSEVVAHDDDGTPIEGVAPRWGSVTGTNINAAGAGGRPRGGGKKESCRSLIIGHARAVRTHAKTKVLFVSDVQKEAEASGFTKSTFYDALTELEAEGKIRRWDQAISRRDTPRKAMALVDPETSE
ncbi:bifunctional DNA primase/polymerase [Smaragdicoccus niigatensis]|nr:bifunctional DNA primase/polymerase [Smaragdicoccus niigatensis]